MSGWGRDWRELHRKYLYFLFKIRITRCLLSLKFQMDNVVVHSQIDYVYSHRSPFIIGLFFGTHLSTRSSSASSASRRNKSSSLCKSSHNRHYYWVLRRVCLVHEPLGVRDRLSSLSSSYATMSSMAPSIKRPLPSSSFLTTETFVVIFFSRLSGL